MIDATWVVLIALGAAEAAFFLGWFVGQRDGKFLGWIEGHREGMELMRKVWNRP